MFKKLKTRLGFKNITSEMVAFYLYKNLRQSIIYRSSVEKVVTPIFACQRAGTSLMLRVFFWDKDTVVFREGSSLSLRDPLRLRLDPLDMVAPSIRNQKAPLVVLKPLVDSQNSLDFLEAIQESKAIWLYRNYRDVVASNLRKFGERNGIDDIRPIFQGQRDNWRSENVSKYTQSIIQKYFSEDMPVTDASALFWFARNQLFFEQKLDSNPRVLLVSYRDFVTDSAETMRRIYGYLHRAYPGDEIIQSIHNQSVGKGSSVSLSPEIETLCEDMLGRLDDVNIMHKNRMIQSAGMFPVSN